MDALTALCDRAALLLASAWQTTVHLEVRERFDSGHVVLRCIVRAEDERASLPGTVILKQRTLNTTPASAGLDQTLLFCNEWASLDFLRATRPDMALGPRLYASDRDQGLVLTEDLGAAPTVSELLYGADPHAGAAALAATGPYLAALQCATHGHEEAFHARQAALGAATVVCDASLDCRARIDELHACMAALGLEPGERFDGAMHELEATIHGAGPFRTFVHNDAGAHNFLAAPGGVRLLDFEFAGYGHGLLDVVCARLAYPPAFRGRVAPPELVRRLEDGYRAELAAHVPAAGDDERFAEAVSQACAHWAYSKLIGFWRAYLRERLAEGEARDERGSTPERRAFFRMQVLTYLRLALATLEERNHLPVLREALARIVERHLRIWPDTPLLGSFPAFGGEPWRYP